MSFFDSEIVQNELRELNEIYEVVCEKMFSNEKEDRLIYIDMLDKFCQKQRILFTRINLSDDPSALEYKNLMVEKAVQMGFPPDIDLAQVFNDSSRLLDNMKKSLEDF